MTKFHFSYRGCYDPKRDGNLEEYLLTHLGYVGPFNLFKGYEWYKILVEKEYLVPHIGVIRLMWNIGRDDEHFVITEDFRLEGMEAPAHAGRKGIHDPKDILTDDGPGWEAHNLNTPKLHEIVNFSSLTMRFISSFDFISFIFILWCQSIPGLVFPSIKYKFPLLLLIKSKAYRECFKFNFASNFLIIFLTIVRTSLGIIFMGM